jgi:hypothetical protein
MVRTQARSAHVLLLVIVAILVAAAPHASAQFGNGGGSTSSGTSTIGNASGSYYDYSFGSSVPMEINIWGFVRSPGKYRVPVSTKLIQLISFAGGPADRARLSDIRILHDVTVDSTIKEPVVIINLAEYQETADPSLNPILTPNDTIIVPGDALNVFAQVLGIVRDVALVLGTLIALYVSIKR